MSKKPKIRIKPYAVNEKGDIINIQDTGRFMPPNIKISTTKAEGYFAKRDEGSMVKSIVGNIHIELTEEEQAIIDKLKADAKRKAVL